VVEQIVQFMDAGGEVLYLIALLTFMMWTLAFERFWYFYTALNNDVAEAIQRWESRSERQSQAAHRVRDLLISEVKLSVQQYLPMIRSIDVFNIMAVSGGGDVKAMASGVSKATIPTMAGMVAALSGVFANTFITQIAETKIMLLEDNLTMDH